MAKEQPAKKLSTKEKIIKTAIQMFNDQGIQRVTCRHIAEEMGISYGNLNYHYNNKEALLLAIYEQMRDEMSNSYLLREEYPTAFEHFYRLLAHLEQFQYKYRFFNLDVLEISRTYPSINRILQKTLKIRKKQMTELFKQFVNEGYLTKRPKEEYERVQHMIRIVITFWLSQEEILTGFQSGNKQGMSGHIWELLRPYMTKQGLAEYNKLETGFSYVFNSQ